MRIQYAPLCHPRYTSLTALGWNQLADAGWEVEYEEPKQYFHNCGARATKSFDSLIQGIMEWEMITGCKIDDVAQYFPGRLESVAVKSLSNFTLKQERGHIHVFTINPGAPDEKTLHGKELKRELKVRINV